jgi:hypothetical protein
MDSERDCQRRTVLPQPAPQPGSPAVPQSYPAGELHPSVAEARGISANDWGVIETFHGAMRARVRFNGNLAPDVVWAQFGWWQACEALRHPGHESDGPTSANYNTLIDTQAVDPLSGTGAEVGDLRGWRVSPTKWRRDVGKD